MNKKIAMALRNKAIEVAEKFSNINRSRNFNAEEFRFIKAIPLSEYTAVVLFEKSSRKYAVAFFYWLNSGDGYWQYFFPSDSHILGMERFGSYKIKVEESNFPKNFAVSEPNSNHE